MNTIDNISELLTLSDSQFRIYDIGRVITKISKKDFEKIELNQMPYPYPSQGNACIAIVFWQKKSLEPYLWFVKLPLDERGLLNQGARNHFIAIIVEALGLEVNPQQNKNDLTLTPSAQQEELLKSNPYHFTPAQYKLAALNSIIKVELKQPPSQHYQYCFDYISGKLGWQNWHNIAIQGLADIAARLNQENIGQLLAKNLSNFPEQVILPLSGVLENQELPLALINTLILSFEKSNGNNLLQQHLLRALAASSGHPHVITLIKQTIEKKDSLDDELLIVIATRCWLALQNNDLLMCFLEKLVQAQDSNLFKALFKDLIAIPTIRPILFTCMRQPNRSNALAQAIGQLFNQLRE
jgi:hypothetical protein